MEDVAQNASPAPAVATDPQSETPQNELSSPRGTPAPTVKVEVEGTPTKLDAVPAKPASPGASPAGTSAPPPDTPAADTPAAPKTEEPDPSPIASSLAQALSIAIPAAADSNVPPATSTPAVPAPPSSSADPAQSSVPPHMHHPTVPTPAISPLSDIAPTKRSRTPEAEEEASAEKRQKTDHAVDEDPSPDVEMKTEGEAGSGLLGWDLGAQLSSVLGAVDPEVLDDANGSAEESKVEEVSPISLLPPPRKRLEKMKFIENPTYFSRAMGLPMLGSLSVQILLALFQQPSEVTDRQIRDVRTEGGKVYTALRETFMAVLKLFANATTFLSADDLDIHDPGDRETIQMANLASMCASFYGPGGPTMATAHDNFLKIMIPESGVITEEISALYLDQKTQSFLAYANVMEDKESTRNSLMDKFFPQDLEDKLKGYWRESGLGTPADEFVQPFTDRRNLLKAIGHDKDKRKALESRYQFASFLDNLSAFIRSNFDSILDYAESHGVEVPNEAGEEDLMLMDAQSTYAGSFPGQPRRSNGAEIGYDSQGLASLITEKLNGFDGYPYGYSSSLNAIPESTTLPPCQTLPTSVLYERARQAAVAKSSAHARREGLQSTRRPWTPEEEKALMAGLDMVKGPHWSQILQLFGLNGTISDILKDRTQVQLKDKARNLKLFFLKTNSEMPYYLQCVTGELKTRAPSQAAKKEAEEQARVQAGSSPGTYASTYLNGGTANGTGSLAHGLPTSGSPRPGSATPGAGPTTPVGANHAHYTPQPSYQQHQSSQPPQTYHQHRPQQLQPAPNGPAMSQPRPLQPQSQHQPIAPAPTYQRTLQQAGAPATQYQQRPLQQPAVQTPATYQQATHQAQRSAAPPAGSSAHPRTGPTSTAMPQIQSRPPVTVGQPPSSAPRAAPAATSAPPRPSSSIPSAAATPPSAAASVPKGVPTVMPAPPSQTPPHSAPAPARSTSQTPAPAPQPASQARVAKQPTPAPAPAPAPASATAPAPPPATAPTPAAAPAPTPAPAPVPPPTSASQASVPDPEKPSSITTSAPTNIPASVPTPDPGRATTPNMPTETAESKEKADDELLAKTLKAALDAA